VKVTIRGRSSSDCVTISPDPRRSEREKSSEKRLTPVPHNRLGTKRNFLSTGAFLVLKMLYWNLDDWLLGKVR
jgi:hypothetical protein